MPKRHTPRPIQRRFDIEGARMKHACWVHENEGSELSRVDGMRGRVRDSQEDPDRVRRPGGPPDTLIT
jgi:hypothetical protein